MAESPSSSVHYWTNPRIFQALHLIALVVIELWRFRLLNKPTVQSSRHPEAWIRRGSSQMELRSWHDDLFHAEATSNPTRFLHPDPAKAQSMPANGRARAM
jgi:hypothetical protein